MSAIQNRTGDKMIPLPDRVTAEQFRAMKSAQKGLGKRRPAHQQHRRGEMNATEREYADHLTAQGWCCQFEAVKLRLAPGVSYTPDFLVSGMRPGSSIEFHEVKGYLRDDARKSFIFAREKFPMFKFRMIVKERGGWREVYAEAAKERQP